MTGRDTRDHRPSALEATRRIRMSPAYLGLDEVQRAEFESNLERLERALRGTHHRIDHRTGHHVDPHADPYAASHGRAPVYGGRDPAVEDPYAGVLQSPAELQQQRMQSGGSVPGSSGVTQAQPAQSQSAVSGLGDQVSASLDAIDFPSFVSGLVTGTFQAIVDSSAQQMREYAALVASLAQSVDDFTRDNVTPNQGRDWLAERYPNDLRLELPAAGQRSNPRLLPRDSARGRSPTWLEVFGLAGRELDDEFTDTVLLEAGRRSMAEERMQQLATLVLMGINRIVVDQGNIRAKLQFHAKAVDSRSAAIQAATAGQKAGIASQYQRLQQGSTTAVSTVKANVQAESSIKASLMGEVVIQFRTETFPLERFADSDALQLLNRHARTPASDTRQESTPDSTPEPASTQEQSSG